MNQLTHIIYIPGLGDGYDPARSFALGFWKHKGVTVQLVPMKWRDMNETFEQKCARVLEAVDTAVRSHEKVVLIGESAGGSMAMNLHTMYPERISKTITICGKNIGATNVSPRLYKNNPAFRESMAHAEAAVANMSAQRRQLITTFYSTRDPVVFPKDTLIEGTVAKKLPTTGHLLSIATVLVFLKHRIIKEAI